MAEPSDDADNNHTNPEEPKDSAPTPGDDDDAVRLMESKIPISLLPFATLVILSPINETVAIGLALAISSAMVGATYCRSKKQKLRQQQRPDQQSQSQSRSLPEWRWLEISLLLGLLACGIAHAVAGTPMIVLQCVPTTFLAVAVAVSIAAGDPFAARDFRSLAKPERAATPGFERSCRILSGYWGAVLFVTALCQWMGCWLFVASVETREITNPLGFVFLGTVIPVCLPLFVAPRGCGMVLRCLRRTGDDEGGGDDEEGGADNGGDAPNGAAAVGPVV